MDVLTVSGQTRSLLLKDSRWTLLQLTAAIEPLKATRIVFGGQLYVTSSLVLPVVASLVERYMYLEDSGDANMIVVTNIHNALGKELRHKFRIA